MRYTLTCAFVLVLLIPFTCIADVDEAFEKYKHDKELPKKVELESKINKLANEKTFNYAFNMNISPEIIKKHFDTIKTKYDNYEYDNFYRFDNDYFYVYTIDNLLKEYEFYLLKKDMYQKLSNLKALKLIYSTLKRNKKYDKFHIIKTSKKASIQSNINIDDKICNVAVFNFTPKNVSAPEASIISDFIRTEIVKLNKYTVVEKNNMELLLAEQGFQQSGCTESDCAVKMGKILNVKQMVVGSLSKLGDTYFITANLVDVETGKILISEDGEAKTPQGIKTACQSIVSRMVR
ncbi:MAG: hypothetical protein JW871_04315 [Endomicrobiales bacterium]|nr:hypothetical protein [Endomicrobiales bacterium]